jgi:hypothetical protein
MAIKQKFGLSEMGEYMLYKLYDYQQASPNLDEVLAENKRAKKVLIKYGFKIRSLNADLYKITFDVASNPDEHGRAEGLIIHKSFRALKNLNIAWVCHAEYLDVVSNLGLTMIPSIKRGTVDGFETFDGFMKFANRLRTQLDIINAELLINDCYPYYMDIK